MAKKRRKVKEEKKLEMAATQTIQYMRNCMYWIEKYWAGKTDEERFKSAIRSLREHTYKIELERPEIITHHPLTPNSKSGNQK